MTNTAMNTHTWAFLFTVVKHFQVKSIHISVWFRQGCAAISRTGDTWGQALPFLRGARPGVQGLRHTQPQLHPRNTGRAAAFFKTSTPCRALCLANKVLSQHSLSRLNWNEINWTGTCTGWALNQEDRKEQLSKSVRELQLSSQQGLAPKWCPRSVGAQHPRFCFRFGRRPHLSWEWLTVHPKQSSNDLQLKLQPFFCPGFCSVTLKICSQKK